MLQVLGEIRMRNLYKSCTLCINVPSTFGLEAVFDHIHAEIFSCYSLDIHMACPEEKASWMIDNNVLVNGMLARVYPTLGSGVLLCWAMVYGVREAFIAWTRCGAACATHVPLFPVYQVKQSGFLCDRQRQISR
jgi:hypothetical protein